MKAFATLAFLLPVARSQLRRVLPNRTQFEELLEPYCALAKSIDPAKATTEECQSRCSDSCFPTFNIKQYRQCLMGIGSWCVIKASINRATLAKTNAENVRICDKDPDVTNSFAFRTNGILPVGDYHWSIRWLAPKNLTRCQKARVSLITLSSKCADEQVFLENEIPKVVATRSNKWLMVNATGPRGSCRTAACAGNVALTSAVEDADTLYCLSTVNELPFFGRVSDEWIVGYEPGAPTFIPIDARLATPMGLANGAID